MAMPAGEELCRPCHEVPRSLTALTYHLKVCHTQENSPTGEVLVLQIRVDHQGAGCQNVLEKIANWIGCKNCVDPATKYHGHLLLSHHIISKFAIHKRIVLQVSFWDFKLGSTVKGQGFKMYWKSLPSGLAIRIV